jgi:ribosomal protein S18 acetylase RimI-like enzyme
MIRIRAAASPEYVQIVRELFLEYSNLPGVIMKPGEAAGLPGEYGAPPGALLVALDGRTGAGCVALRRLDDRTCEMKRLYVRPAYRGQGVGRDLVREIIARARRLGYERMRLDTRPSMKSAIALYRSIGFREIPAYLSEPMPGAIFFELELR